MRRSVVLILVAVAGVLVPASPASSAPAWDWPLSPRPKVTRTFDLPSHRYGAGHRGVDLAAAPGSPVLAAGAGTVGYVGVIAGRPVMTVMHAGGLRTTYEPVVATLAVGTPVATGTVIGTLAAGHAGCPAAGCLHWGLKRGETYLNPLSLLRPRRVRLLPNVMVRSGSALRPVGAPVGR